ncbi:hypothetical protein [Aquimarina sp. 2201CG5-10]|uniref:TolB family protein n=1 Tax=Aquimarina callyspongiae TaxID=3098150 RepID=UPI002AB413F7|nr:hypothetical protein [Aquimarina sp. 2201CG5-10]MDY8133974.1 hypothetical protein [Aquimarina sp. 2201CG5-10]
MFLRKNYLGLFFFSLGNTVFSQGKQLEIANTNFVENTFVETEVAIKEVQNDLTIAKLYEKSVDENVLDIGANQNKNLSKEWAYDSLLTLLTSKEERSERFMINTLKINSEYSDYAPSFYEKELVFASSRNSNRVTRLIDELSNQPFLDLYSTTRSLDKISINRLRGSVNTKFHESSAVFSKDKKAVYFTRNNYSKRKSKTNTEGTVLLKIYRAIYKEGKWGKVEELPFNSDEYSIAHPALSSDGKYLYFASDMPGSYGKSDLYMVEIYKDGSFGVPENMGDLINTPGRETFPYVSDKGNLFFASDGHPGMGGLDIFMLLPSKKGMTGVYNLGLPLNSPEDDFTFIINEKCKTGYFASNRKGGKGDDDIYGFRQLLPFPKYFPDFKVKRSLERHIDKQESEQAITSY